MWSLKDLKNMIPHGYFCGCALLYRTMDTCPRYLICCVQIPGILNCTLHVTFRQEKCAKNNRQNQWQQRVQEKVVHSPTPLKTHLQGTQKLRCVYSKSFFIIKQLLLSIDDFIISTSFYRGTGAAIMFLDWDMPIPYEFAFFLCFQHFNSTYSFCLFLLPM